MDEFNISLEGSTARINDKIRGEGAFSKAVKGISLLERYGASITVRMTFFQQEEKEVEYLIRLLPEIGVYSFNFRYVVPVGRAQGSYVSSSQYKRLSERILELGEKLNIRIGFSDPFPEILVNPKSQNDIESDKEIMSGKAVSGCSVAFGLLYLDPQGIVRLCPYFPVTCDDAKTKSLEDIWFNNQLLQAMREIRGALEGKCGDCEYKYACGGCRGAALATGNFLAEDIRCWK